MRVNVLTGLAGTGKTAMLARLAADGEQVIDLEGLAAHRGSSFGRIGIASPLPTEHEFHALVREALANCDPRQPVWLEDEGPHIGPLRLPPEMIAAIATAETVELSGSVEERVRRLSATYASSDPRELIDATQRIRRRLGNPRTDRAISHFHAGRPDAAIISLLEYFDRGYILRASHTARRVVPPRAVPAAIRCPPRDDE